MDNGEYYSRIFFMIVFALLVVASFWVLSPLIYMLIGAVLLAYIFFPIYKRLLKFTKNKNVSASIILILLILIAVIPSIYIGNTLAKEGMQIYLLTKQKIASGKFIDVDCAENDKSLACKINSKTSSILSNPQYKYYVENALGKITNFIIEKTTEFIIALPQLFLGLFIMLFTIFFLLKDHEIFINKIKELTPLKKSHKESIFKEFANLAHATVYGQFVVGLVQGIVATICYFIFNVHSPLVWGLLTTIVAMIPFLGTPLVWVPISLNMIISGNIIGGTGLFLVGLLIISAIDNFLKPKIIGDRTKLHPVFVLAGIVGGIMTMGVIGVIIGPLVISLLISFIEIYHEEEKKNHSTK